MGNPSVNEIAERYLKRSFLTSEQYQAMVVVYMNITSQFGITADDTARCAELARTITDATLAGYNNATIMKLAETCMRDYTARH